MPDVLLDACVLFPMYLRDTLLSTAEAGLYLPYWSQEILNEATRNLMSTGKMTAEQAMKLEADIKETFPDSMVEVPIGLTEVMKNHPKDRHVLAAAVRANAEIIVTNNLKDFPTEALAPWDIKAQCPDDFLTDLFDEAPDSIVQVLQRQSNKYQKRKLTFAELLELLREKAKTKKFARNVFLYEYSGVVVQTAKQALSKFGKTAPEGGRFLEGERYRLWQQGQTLTITAKDGRGEILRLQDDLFDGNLSSDDIKAFETIEQELAKPMEQQQEGI